MEETEQYRGLRSWASYSPAAALHDNLIDSFSPEYDERASTAILSALASADKIPVLYESQLAAVVWERLGVLLHPADSVILWRLVSFVDGSIPTSVSEALGALSELYRHQWHSSRASMLRNRWSRWKGPMPSLPREPMKEIFDNERNIHFQRFDLSDAGIVRLHLYGRGLDLDGTHDVDEIIKEDIAAVQEQGCAYAGGCVYAPQEPWRPEEGMLSPYPAADGSRRVLCLAHGQLETFAHR